MSVPSSTVTLLTMITILLWLSLQLTSHPSLGYNLYPMPVNWDPLVELNYTDNHNISSLLTGESLPTAASKCASHLHTHLNASRVCTGQLYDWVKMEMDYAFPDMLRYSQRWELIDKYVRITLTCYFRLACVHCPAEQVTAYRKVVEDWFHLYRCYSSTFGSGCYTKPWYPPRLTECFEPPVTELKFAIAQCDAALEQANATDKCTAQVQAKLNQSKHDRPRQEKCEAEYEDRRCMVAQVCAHCQPEHIHKYFDNSIKVGDPAFDECRGFYYYPQRKCTVDYTVEIIIGGVVTVFLIILLFVIFCYQTQNRILRDTLSFKRPRKYGTTGRSISKKHTTRGSSSSSSSVKAK